MQAKKPVKSNEETFQGRVDRMPWYKELKENKWMEQIKLDQGQESMVDRERKRDKWWKHFQSTVCKPTSINMSKIIDLYLQKSV